MPIDIVLTTHNYMNKSRHSSNKYFEWNTLFAIKINNDLLWFICDLSTKVGILLYGHFDRDTLFAV